MSKWVIIIGSIIITILNFKILLIIDIDIIIIIRLVIILEILASTQSPIALSFFIVSRFPRLRDEFTVLSSWLSKQQSFSSA